MEHETLFRNKWIDVRRTADGYTYSHCNHGKGHGVAVLVYRPGQVLGRFEVTPAHGDNKKLCSITGGVENGDPITTTINELREEAGIVADTKDLEWLGEVWPSKASDTVMHLYAIMWRGEVNRHPDGDGSAGEVGSEVDWIPWQNAMLAQDPLLPCMLGRMMIIKSHEFV